ncbi:DEAD/DEAH box helicase [Herbiconiux daphne]|uniref:DEAD/DEAH box helicase n=1 Tax=Herbiconiux daphne TaxID=2970914 RepID=A0ABT2H3T4_9MICO|nr:DEAD/DEAH box helicase [Herbiconiux daphne]MCS5734601.1 DEAD/DEAH box helicase [Herbiconiux daphne]
MPKTNKSGGFKAAKNYEPRTPGKGGPKAGSRSPGHRGYKAVDETSPRKQRWNADDRASRGAAPSGRGAERPSYTERSERPLYNDRNGGRPAREGERGGYDRPARGGYERPSRENGFHKSGTGTGRSERPAYDRGDRSDRPSYDRGDRPAYDRGDRPAYDRGERSSYDRSSSDRSFSDRSAREGGRGGAPKRTDRQLWNDARNEERRAAAAAERGAERAAGGKPPRADDRGYNRSARPTADYQPGERADRPARSYDDRPKRSYDRADRPAYGDRAPRTGGYDRAERPARTERPAYGDRPATSDRAPRTTGYDRADRADRPARADRSERPAYGDRAPRTGGYDRPARSFDDRPKRSFDRDDRAPRSGGYDRADRAPRSDRADRGSDFYPSRDAKPAFHGDDDVVLERLEAQATLAEEVEGATFASLGLGGNIVRVLGELGAESPFPIQSATIPEVLKGRDVLGRGRTGSGKTIAFGAPLVERLMENGGGANRKPGRKPRALILAPTRELALQIDRTVQPIARAVGLFTTQIYGGVPQARQVGALQRGVDIIIGTPGRIEDLIEQRRLDLSEVTITVLDEADHMCDLGFLEPVQRILRHTKDGGQKLLFSATLDKGVANLVDEFLVNPSVHEVAGEDQASSTIDHRVLIVESRDKSEIIRQLADRDGKTLIFARTRAYAEMLAEQLEDAGFPATSLHGDLNQSRRTRNLAQLTSGRVSVLVATDVAARGIHVDDIDLVIQADAPDEYKTYLHRAGRTGRAGKKGTVVTLIPRSRGRRMQELLGRAEIEAEMITVAPGDTLVRELAADHEIVAAGTRD